MTVYALQDYDLQICRFIYRPGVTSARIGSGYTVNRSQTFSGLFEVFIQTKPLNRVERAQWAAWFALLRGGRNLARIYDVSKHPPRNYPNANESTDISAGWDGETTVTAISGYSLTLGAVPTGYEAKKGDYVGLVEGGQYDLYQIMANVSESGGSLALTVEPALRTSVFSTSAVGDLWKPQATFVIDPDSWTDEDSALGPTPISFRGFQVI